MRNLPNAQVVDFFNHHSSLKLHLKVNQFVLTFDSKLSSAFDNFVVALLEKRQCASTIPAITNNNSLNSLHFICDQIKVTSKLNFDFRSSLEIHIFLAHNSHLVSWDGWLREAHLKCHLAVGQIHQQHLLRYENLLHC